MSCSEERFLSQISGCAAYHPYNNGPSSVYDTNRSVTMGDFLQIFFFFLKMKCLDIYIYCNRLCLLQSIVANIYATTVMTHNCGIF